MGFITTHRTDGTTWAVHLFSFTVGVMTYYWTDADVRAYDGAQAYDPAPMRVPGFGWRSGQILGTVQVEFGSNATWGAVLAAGSLLGAAATVKVAWLDPAAASTVAGEVYTVVDGQVLDASLRAEANGGAETIVLTVGLAADLSAVIVPRRTKSRRCDWLFKGPGCAYAGGTTSCDHSLTTCGSLSNQTRFGGFPYATVGGV